MKNVADKKTWQKILKSMAGRHVIHRAKTRTINTDTSLRSKFWIDEFEDRDVILLATADNFSMIRRPKCFPYVVSNCDLMLIALDEP
jgi:hypothetical protein